MILRLARSRGARKFRRNRLAMGALGVVALYLLLAGWIVLTNLANDLGKWTGAWTLERSPIMGLFLRERTADRVGAPHMPGFGLRPKPEKRAEHYAYMLSVVAGPAFDRLAGLTDEGEIRAVLREPVFAERGFADRPSAELREIYERALAAAARADRYKARISQLGVIDRAIESVDRAREMVRAGQSGQRDALLTLVSKSKLPIDEVREALATADAGDDADLRELLREELALTIENLSLAIEQYQDAAEDEDALTAVDAGAIFDAADAVYDSDDPLNAYDHASLIEALPAIIREVSEELPKRAAARVDETGEHLDKLFPLPTGIKGLVYRFKLMLGTDRQGRSIMVRSLYSSKIAIQVGFVVGLIAVSFGSILGAAAAFYGGRVDHAVNWLYSLFTSIPSLVLLVVLAFMFTGSAVERTLIPLFVSFSVTYWIGPCRVVRGETMKIKELEYVHAATAMGFGRFYILLRHILPNTLHLMFINFSLLFIGAIKGEVILTFLGLGVKPPTPSWGIMIRQSASEVPNEFFWQMGAATFFMFVLVLAFNIISDALQDAFDPKHQG